MLILRKRIPTRHRHHVRKKRWNSLLVLHKQMQKKLNKTETRFTQNPMDKILRKRSKRKSLTKHTPVFSKHNPPKTSHEYAEKKQNLQQTIVEERDQPPTLYKLPPITNTHQTTDFTTLFHNSSLKIQPTSEALTSPPK